MKFIERMQEGETDWLSVVIYMDLGCYQSPQKDKSHAVILMQPIPVCFTGHIELRARFEVHIAALLKN